MQAIRDLEQKEAMEDLFFGQVAIIWARWFLILTGGLLAVWNASTLSNLTVSVVPVALLMGMNFYLHGRYLMEKPVGAKLVLLTSILDVILISLLVLLRQGSDGPIGSEFFVFFYPMVLAFALVMPRKIEVAYTVFADLGGPADAHAAGLRDVRRDLHAVAVLPRHEPGAAHRVPERAEDPGHPHPHPRGDGRTG